MIFNTIYGGGGIGCKPLSYVRYEIANAVANTQYDIGDTTLEDQVICVWVNGTAYYVYRTEYGVAINYEGTSYTPFSLVQFDTSDDRVYITFKADGDYYGEITSVCPDWEPLVVTLDGALNPFVANSMDMPFMDILVEYLTGRPIIFREYNTTNYYSMDRIYYDGYNYAIDFDVYDGYQCAPMSFTAMNREDNPAYNISV